MKRAAKWASGVVVVLALVAGAVAGYVYWRYPAVAAAETVHIEATPERLARGRYLFDHVAICADCHSTRDWSKYAAPITPGTMGKGGEPFTPEIMPGLPGSFYARNITPAGIGDWTDGEVLRAITSGVDKHGTPLFPLMPYLAYGQMDREDAEAIVAYVRTLAPIPNDVPERSLDFPMHLIVRTIPQPAHFSPRPDPSDKRAYGEYLVNVGACQECHTPADSQGQRLADRRFSGGVEFQFPWGGVVRSANITPDADSGIGTWTEQQFVDKFKAFAEGPEQVLTTAAERQQNTIMPWKPYGGMTREDLSAIYTYLRSQPPIVNRVEKFGTTLNSVARH